LSRKADNLGARGLAEIAKAHFFDNVNLVIGRIPDSITRVHHKSNVMNCVRIIAVASTTKENSISLFPLRQGIFLVLEP
jgi:hypothetical protein